MTIKKTRRTYSKICVMCNNSFVAFQINTLYCSKKCSNDSRSLPAELKLQLIRRNSAYTLATDKFVAHMASGERFVTTVEHRPAMINEALQVKGASKSNPAGDDLALLVEFAKTEATKRGITPLTDNKLEDFYLTNKPHDAEAASFKLPDVKTIDETQTNQTPVLKTGIRKIGGGK